METALTERNKKILNGLNGRTKNIWENMGLKPRMVQWLYTVVVRPMITYGSLIWWQKVNQRQAVEKLECSEVSLPMYNGSDKKHTYGSHGNPAKLAASLYLY
jgi:hypothetical protein